jgi:hypothetical protein
MKTDLLRAAAVLDGFAKELKASHVVCNKWVLRTPADRAAMAEYDELKWLARQMRIAAKEWARKTVA